MTEVDELQPLSVASRPREPFAGYEVVKPAMASSTSETDDSIVSQLEPQLDAETSSFIIRVSELADKYWNGSKSLLKNPRFKSKYYFVLMFFCLALVFYLTAQCMYEGKVFFHNLLVYPHNEGFCWQESCSPILKQS